MVTDTTAFSTPVQAFTLLINYLIKTQPFKVFLNDSHAFSLNFPKPKICPVSVFWAFIFRFNS